MQIQCWLQLEVESAEHEPGKCGIYDKHYEQYMSPNATVSEQQALQREKRPAWSKNKVSQLIINVKAQMTQPFLHEVKQAPVQCVLYNGKKQSLCAYGHAHGHL